ncbi:MAG: gliding motility-associated C-terminal domain-containing protein [bacterium]|nr:gliding motility-associated C-terminal domain-containing protein [bacterium]
MIKILWIIIILAPSMIRAQYTPFISPPELTAEVTLSSPLPPGNYDGYTFSGDTDNVIQIVGDNIYLTLILDNSRNNTNAVFCYKTPVMEDYESREFIPGIINQTDYRGTVLIRPDKQVPGIIYYYLELYNSLTGIEYLSGSPSDPRHMTLCQENSKNLDVSGGDLKLSDANPYDGENKMEFADGFVENKINLTFKQIYPVPRDGIYRDCVAVYSLEPHNSMFQKFCALTLLYFDIDNDGYVDGSSIKEEELRLCRYDGIEWLNLGGTADGQKNTVQAPVMQTGLYGLIPAGKLKPVQLKPYLKIITPNNDGVNDYLVFNGVYGPFKLEIFDISGNRIKSISSMPYWDGTDTDQKTVPMGVYMYVLETGKLRVRGVCAVAK